MAAEITGFKGKSGGDGWEEIKGRCDWRTSSGGEEEKKRLIKQRASAQSPLCGCLNLNNASFPN